MSGDTGCSMRTKILAVAVFFMGMPATGAPLPKNRHVPFQRTDVSMAPSLYAARVAGLDSCEQFAASWTTYPFANSLLRKVQYSSSLSGRGNKKDEFETTGTFEARRSAFWGRTLGDMTRILIDARVDPDYLDYDTNTGIMKVRNFISDDIVQNADIIKFHERLAPVGAYTGQNGFGARVNVNRFQGIEEDLLFPRGQLNGKGGSVSADGWRISMQAAEARAFKSDPHVIIWASLKSPYYELTGEHLGATLDSPIDYNVTQHYWHGRVKCAFFTDGKRVIEKIAVDPNASDAIDPLDPLSRFRTITH